MCTTTINCFIFVPQVCCHLCSTTWLETSTFSEFNNSSCVGQSTYFPASFPKCSGSPTQLILQAPMALLPRASPLSLQVVQVRCRAAAQKPSCKSVLVCGSHTEGMRGDEAAAALLFLHAGGGIGPSCSCPLLIPHRPTLTKGFCPRQGWRWASAIQMALPGSEALWLPVVPRRGCPLLRSWRRKLGFAASEGEDAEMF